MHVTQSNKASTPNCTDAPVIMGVRCPGNLDFGFHSGKVQSFTCYADNFVDATTPNSRG